MNFITYWKSYVADKSICLKGHMLIETSSYFVQFDIWRRVSYFAKKFQTKNLLEHYCKSEFHVTCPMFYNSLWYPRKEERRKKFAWAKVCLNSGWA